MKKIGREVRRERARPLTFQPVRVRTNLYNKPERQQSQNSPFLHQRMPNPLPLITAPTHRGMARLSGPESPG